MFPLERYLLKLGKLINLLLVFSLGIGILLYGLFLVDSFYAAAFFRGVTANDLKLHYEGWAAIAIGIAMLWAAHSIPRRIPELQLPPPRHNDLTIN